MSSQAKAVAATAGGNIVAAGWKSVPGASSCANQVPVVVKFNPSGGVFAGFPVQLACPSGAANAYFNSVAIDPDGDIVAAGTQILSPGMTPESFVAWIPVNGNAGPTPTVKAAAGAGGALQSDGLSVIAPAAGTAYVAGDSNGKASVAAFTKASGLSSTFNDNGVQTFASTVSASGVAKGAAGTIYVDGVTSSAGGFLAKVDGSTGAPINAFGSSGIVTTPSRLEAVAYEPLVNIVDAAGTSGTGNSNQMMLEQFDGTNGSPNTAFGSGGVFTTSFAGPSSAEAVATQPDGKVVAAGGAPTPGGTAGNTSLAIIRTLGPALGPTPRIAAFQAAGGDLFSLGPQGWTDWGVGMAPGTSPSMISLPNGGYEISFQANGGALWSVGTLGWINWGVGMAPGTSPSMIATQNAGYEVSFQANGGALWSVGTLGWINWGVGMASHTSPSMISLPGNGFEIGFQANGGPLWTVGTAGWTNWGVGMASGASPDVLALPGGGYEIGFQANGGTFWTIGTAFWTNWRAGMASGTNPSMI